MTAGVECTDRSRIRAAHAAASPAICTVFPAGMESRLKIFRCGIEFGVCIIRRRRPGDQFSSGSVSHIRSGGETGALARPPHPGAGRQAFDLVGTSNTRGAPFLRVLCAGVGFHSGRPREPFFYAHEVKGRGVRPFSRFSRRGHDKPRIRQIKIVILSGVEGPLPLHHNRQVRPVTDSNRNM